MYYDLKFGTIPAHSIPPQTENSNYYMTVKIKPGDTVLSIVEHYQENDIPVPIGEVVEDFKKLNNGLLPEEIEIGKHYKFPVYMDEQDS